MIPIWLTALSWVSLALGVASAAIIAVDVMRRPQHMAVMNVVWPLIALFSSLAGLWFYMRHGRAHAEGGSFPISVAKGTLHCGAGCTLGDIIAETLALAVPAVAVVFGYGTLFGDRIFAIWVLDFILAFVIGVVFQYYAIAPMRGLGVREGLVAAVKADALSLTAWQLGMYGMMALAHFWLFDAVFGVRVTAAMPEFWFAMQVAMLAGFVTSYPANWLLIRSGIKEEM